MSTSQRTLCCLTIGILCAVAVGALSNDNDNNNYHSRRFGHKIGNELNEETAYDCLKPPGSYARRNACCRPLDGRSAQLMECTNTHRKIEQQLARKVAMMQDENASASVPFETFGSIFDCVSDTIRQRRNFGRRTTTTSMPSPAMPTEMPQTTTSAPAQSIEELDTSFENLRAGTIDVLTCAIGENGTDFRQTAKRAFDTCHRRLLASELREREQYARFGGTCSSPTIHMMICLSEQMYVECPNEYWAQEADETECSAWRTHVQKCPTNKMRAAMLKRNGHRHRFRLGRRQSDDGVRRHHNLSNE